MHSHNGTTIERAIPLGTLQYQSTDQRQELPRNTFPSIKCGRYYVVGKNKKPLVAKCPFCNSKVTPFLTVISDGENADFYVKCNFSQCAAEGPVIRSPATAIKQWNGNRSIITTHTSADKTAEIHVIKNFITAEINEFSGNITIDNFNGNI